MTIEHNKEQRGTRTSRRSRCCSAYTFLRITGAIILIGAIVHILHSIQQTNALSKVNRFQLRQQTTRPLIRSSTPTFTVPPQYSIHDSTMHLTLHSPLERLATLIQKIQHLPINQLPGLFTHNTDIGPQSWFVANQKQSLTNILALTAKVGFGGIELHPRTISGQLYTRHSWIQGTQLFTPSIAGIKQWIKENPGCVLIVDLDDPPDTITDNTLYVKEMTALLEKSGLQSHIYTGSTIPSLADMKRQHKPIYVLSQNPDLSKKTPYVHLARYGVERLPKYQSKARFFTSSKAQLGSNIVWKRSYEDRSVPGFLSAGKWDLTSITNAVHQHVLQLGMDKISERDPRLSIYVDILEEIFQKYLYPQEKRQI